MRSELAVIAKCESQKETTGFVRFRSGMKLAITRFDMSQLIGPASIVSPFSLTFRHLWRRLADKMRTRTLKGLWEHVSAKSAPIVS